MFKLVIVDDEQYIRDGMKNSFPWEELGFSAVYTAIDGIEALNLIQVVKPDVILTDIRMPRMDGIQLAKRVKEQFPGIFVIFISAYDDFEYAREGIKYGVKGYLLKPIKQDELLGVLKATTHELSKTKKNGLLI